MSFPFPSSVAGIAQSVQRLLRAGQSDDRGSIPGGGGNFLFDTASRLALGLTQPPIQWVPRTLPLEVKRPRREADHSPPYSDEIKESVDLYLHSPNTSSWRDSQLKHRDTFTFYLWFSILDKEIQANVHKLFVTSVTAWYPWGTAVVQVTGLAELQHNTVIRINYTQLSFFHLQANFLNPLASGKRDQINKMSREQGFDSRGRVLFSSQPRPDRLWDPLRFLSNGIGRYFPRGKADGAWIWSLTSLYSGG
jgi:hypothetical protein